MKIYDIWLGSNGPVGRMASGVTVDAAGALVGYSGGDVVWMYSPGEWSSVNRREFIEVVEEPKREELMKAREEWAKRAYPGDMGLDPEEVRKASERIQALFMGGAK